MSGDESDDEIRRGPKGGRKHTPGRGHDRKSRRAKGKKFRKEAERKRRALEEEARRQWAKWDRMSEFERRLFPEEKPALPRPKS